MEHIYDHGDRYWKESEKYASYQEAVRKSVERVFGVLFKRFNVLYMPFRLWYTEDMRTIMSACVVIHNVLEEERRGNIWKNGMGGIRQDFLVDSDAADNQPQGLPRVLPSEQYAQQHLERHSPSRDVENLSKHTRLKTP